MIIILKNSYDKKANLSFKNKDVSQKFKVNKKIDIIIHAAGIASPFYYRQKPLETLDVAINGTRNCLEIAKKFNSKFIFLVPVRYMVILILHLFQQMKVIEEMLAHKVQEHVMTKAKDWAKLYATYITSITY